MTENFDNTDPEPQNDGGRNIWKRLDLLLSFAERQTRDANHDDPNSLLWALNYLWEVESLLQQELDYAVISLKEFWRYRSTDIAAAMGTKWEHDRSHLIIAVPDNGLCQVVSTGEHYFLKQPGRLPMIPSRCDRRTTPSPGQGSHSPTPSDASSGCRTPRYTPRPPAVPLRE